MLEQSINSERIELLKLCGQVETGIIETGIPCRGDFYTCLPFWQVLIIMIRNEEQYQLKSPLQKTEIRDSFQTSSEFLGEIPIHKGAFKYDFLLPRSQNFLIEANLS